MLIGGQHERELSALRTDDLTESLNVFLEHLAPRLGEGQPCTWAFAYVPLADGYVSGLLQRGDLTGQHRVADSEGVPEKSELELVRLRQGSHEREPHGLMNERVEAGARVGQSALLR